MAQIKTAFRAIANLLVYGRPTNPNTGSGVFRNVRETDPKKPAGSNVRVVLSSSSNESPWKKISSGKKLEQMKSGLKAELRNLNKDSDRLTTAKKAYQDDFSCRSHKKKAGMQTGPDRANAFGKIFHAMIEGKCPEGGWTKEEGDFADKIKTEFDKNPDSRKLAALHAKIYCIGDSAQKIDPEDVVKEAIKFWEDLSLPNEDMFRSPVEESFLSAHNERFNAVSKSISSQFQNIGDHDNPMIWLADTSKQEILDSALHSELFKYDDVGERLFKKVEESLNDKRDRLTEKMAELTK